MSFFRKILLCLIFVCPLTTSAQGIRGTIYNHLSEPLPYASIYVAELKDGASSNQHGSYQIPLSPGRYTIIVQFIGYEKKQLQVEITDGWLDLDIHVQEQVLMLREVEVKSKKEDPALTIMRKAISKRKYHLLQYDSYQVKVYIKGTGQLTKVPFFVKKQLKEEGVQVNEAYTSESVSEITFEQPDKISERVISIRTSGENNAGGATPSMFITQSFYNDQIAEAVSPLAGSAFNYYKFQYEGSFKEGAREINKIKVTPRSRGENVFEGYIYIIEDHWAIHSLDLRTSILGFQVHAKQNYAEVAANTWMPVTHQYKFWGKFLGFAGEYNYLASCSDYKVELNKDLLVQTQIIDEKVEEVPQNLKINKPSEKNEIIEVLENEDKMTRKQYRKMIEQYEKESLKERTEPDVLSERDFKIDSLATKRDSSYWAGIRPVPLSEKEVRGYQRDDSLARVHTARVTGVDSTKSIKRTRFKPFVILLGGNYHFGPKVSFQLNPTFAQTYYNTVEGFNINLSGNLKYRYDSLRKNITISPTVRYGFASNTLYYKTRINKQFEKGERRTSFSIEGGKFVEQFNEDRPIHPHINTLSSLIFRRNFMKIYEKTYGLVEYSYRASPKFDLKANVEFAQRIELFDHSEFSFFYREPRTFSSNQPVNFEMEDTGFPKNEALIFRTELRFRPGVTYRINNGHKYPVLNNSPLFILKYSKGIPSMLGSDVDFDQLELGVNHNFKFGVSGKLEFELAGGSFLNNNKMYFMDYQHFDGNRTILSSLRPAGAFRLLDYYAYSTSGNYFTGHSHYQFRKFLITQLPEIRISGLRENIFINYLKTSNSPHYYELGYSIDNILRMFRVEVAGSFIDSKFHEVGLRIGIATFIKIN